MRDGWSWERDGVHDLWHGATVVFEPGMRIALGDVVLMHASMSSLLLFQSDERLPEGAFQVEAATDEGFRFRAHLAPDLHKFLQRGSADRQYGHIVTHIVSACFGLLEREYRDDEGDEGWQSFQGLKALAGLLSSRALPHWSDADFSPELAASTLYPHRLAAPPESAGAGD